METFMIPEPPEHISKDKRAKRRFIEMHQLSAFLHTGRGQYHFENVICIRHILRGVLKCIGLYGRGLRNALAPVIREVSLEFENLPENFSGLRLMHLSDLHIDGNDALADRLCEILGCVEVDLCVFTGDYRFEVCGSFADVVLRMEKIVDSIKARHGIIGILGNHDFLAEGEALEKLGVRLLVNESIKLHRGSQHIHIVGLDDPHYYGCDDIDLAMENVPESDFNVLLVHTPEMIEDAAQKGIDLYLCGHTHGGQICLPFIGPLMYHAKCKKKFAGGPWQYNGVTGNTSRGLGSSLVPVRFNCPPEIVVITLKRKGNRDGIL